MIYTLTLNPAVDLELQISDFAFNSVARAQGSRMDCGGKGFNVSRMLRNLDVDSTAMGFVGGLNGQRLTQALAAMGIATHFTEIAGETRTNVSVVAHDSGQHIKVNESGPEITAAELTALVDAVQERLSPGDWWVLGGSLPRGVPDTIYADLIQRIESAGAHAVLDTSGAALRAGCLAGPTLVKPNVEEAMQLLGLSAADVSGSDDWASAVLGLGPKNLVVSLGKDGALYATADTLAAVQSPSVVESNPIGAGDSMVAGLVWKLSTGASLPEAMPWGLACGAATASRRGTELGSLTQVTDLVASMTS
ncbi:1-phosphofructokinase [Reinekea sp. G2M2-21]|uniref:1-phosphofructokinase n=1 Tax=Reinekea sp. G2M2-21 TaxID=2788942 RepID=UPI0018AA0618|nr:1-phosphofructokinase [Reinekea sp. G2M2-21]